MLSYDKEKLIPLCSQCLKELKEISVKSTNTNYYEFDSKTRQYKQTQRMKVEDDNVFHYSECGADFAAWSCDDRKSIVFNEIEFGFLDPQSHV